MVYHTISRKQAWLAINGTIVILKPIKGVIVIRVNLDSVIDKIESRMGDIVKQVSVDRKVIGVIEKWKDNRCF